MSFGVILNYKEVRIDSFGFFLSEVNKYLINELELFSVRINDYFDVDGIKLKKSDLRHLNRIKLLIKQINEKILNYTYSNEIKSINDLEKIKNFITSITKKLPDEFICLFKIEIIDKIDIFINGISVLEFNEDVDGNIFETKKKIFDLLNSFISIVISKDDKIKKFKELLIRYEIIKLEKSDLEEKLNKLLREKQKNNSIILSIGIENKGLLNKSDNDKNIIFELKQDIQNKIILIKQLEEEIQQLKLNIDNDELGDNNENRDNFGNIQVDELISFNNELLSENSELIGENVRLKDEVNGLRSKNSNLIESILKAQNLSELDRYLLSCEINLYEKSFDELLKYICYSDCSINLKQNLILIIINILDELLHNTSKGNSSGTNGKEGTAGGKYSNKFFNPIINYFKDKLNSMQTQKALEYLIGFSFKNLIGEYNQDVSFISQKDKTISNVYFNIDDKYLPLNENLLYLADVLCNLNISNVDLTSLSNNILDSITNKQDYYEREIRKIVEKIIKDKIN